MGMSPIANTFWICNWSKTETKDILKQNVLVKIYLKQHQAHVTESLVTNVTEDWNKDVPCYKGTLPHSSKNVNQNFTINLFKKEVLSQDLFNGLVAFNTCTPPTLFIFCENSWPF